MNDRNKSGNPYVTLFILEPVQYITRWKKIITGRLKEVGYKNMGSNWMHHNLSSSHDHWKLQIDR